MRIAALRYERGLTQMSLADRAGISLETVSKVEQQKRTPTLAMLETLSDALGVTSAQLLDPGSSGRRDYLPAEVVGRPDFAAACRERDIGAVFRIAVDEGFSVSHLARQCEMTISTVSSYMKKGRQARSMRVIERVSDGLHIPGELLRVGRREWEAESPQIRISGDSHSDAKPSDSGVNGANRESEHLWRPGGHSEEIRDIMTWIASTNTTDDAIEQVARATEYLAEAHCKIPPNMVLDGVWQAHQTVGDVLLSGKQRLRQTRELLRIDSELLAYACLILGNLGQHQRAAECGTAALVMAQEAGCDEGIAWSAQAKTARWQQKYVEAAEAARRGFEVSAPSPVKVELAYREANAIALFGDTARARQALKRARQAAETMPANHGNPRSVWSFPTGRQAIFELSVAIHTGDPGSALRAAAMAEASWASGEPKIPATWAQIQAGSSIAYLMQDSLDEVAHHITPILELPAEMRISTVTGYLQKLKSLLAQPRFAKNNTATELALQITDFISSSPLDTDEIEPI